MFGVDISQVIEAFEPVVSTEYMPSFFSAYCGSEFSAVFIESDFAISPSRGFNVYVTGVSTFFPTSMEERSILSSICFVVRSVMDGT